MMTLGSAPADKLIPLFRERSFWRQLMPDLTEEEIARNTGVLSKEQLDEFHEALAAWKKIQAAAR